jgi:hypothetical protein
MGRELAILSRCATVTPMRTIVFFLALFALTLNASAAGLTGTYKGTWSGNTGGGDFTITLDTHDNANPKAQVSFSYSGEEVKCDVTSVKIDGSKVTVVYKFEIEEMQLQSTLTGELQGKTLQGTYETKSLSEGSGVDEGTWKTTAE